jgi:DNA-directed RNA polymerase
MLAELTAKLPPMLIPPEPWVSYNEVRTSV